MNVSNPKSLYDVAVILNFHGPLLQETVWSTQKPITKNYENTWGLCNNEIKIEQF